MKSQSASVRRQTKAAKWEDLVERNLPLVKYVLGKLSSGIPPSVDRDDLLAAGHVGMIEAAKRFDPSRNVPFHSYAIPRIFGSMLDELRSHDWLSTDMRDKVNRLRERMAYLEQVGAAKPSDEELADFLGCPVEKVSRIKTIAAAQPHQSDSETILAEASTEGGTVRLGTDRPRDPYEETAFRDEKALLAQAMAGLPDRERQVMMLRYHEELYLHEIGEMLGVSESRVCQLHSQAVERLRTALARAGMSLGGMHDG